MLTPSGQRRSTARRPMLAALALLALCLPTLALAAPPPYDLGDAPDSTNTTGVPMLAYSAPNVPANYPSVFFTPAAGPRGPLHTAPTANAWLGAGVTCEQDADLNDCDPTTNIIPGANAANRDLRDDGVNPPNGGILNLPQCGQTQFRYIVTGVAAPPAPKVYVNVWFDWNRDGDWADVLTCQSAGGVFSVPEWAVQNQSIPVPLGASAVFATPLFRSFHTGSHRDVWMRINVAELPAPTVPGSLLADGRGPNTPYRYGETEDYFVKYTGTATQFAPQ